MKHHERRRTGIKLKHNADIRPRAYGANSAHPHRLVTPSATPQHQPLASAYAEPRNTHVPSADGLALTPVIQ